MEKINIKLVATPYRLSDNIRSKLEELDSILFEGEVPYPKDGCYWWIAYMNHEPVAFAGLKVLKGCNKNVGFLCRAGVLKLASGKGLQRKLIAIRLNKAKKMKLSEVITYTHNANYKSAANLLRSGMRFYCPKNKWAGQQALYFHYVFH